MAVRPVFVPSDSVCAVTREDVDFQWFPGMSRAQHQRSVDSQHEAWLSRHPGKKILEISSNSRLKEGIELSAFNLLYTLKDGRKAPVECVYHAGKVFRDGGPFLNLIEGTSREARKFFRQNSYGPLLGFAMDGEIFALVPATNYYNWLWIHALMDHPELADFVMQYDAFTDFAFNPAKSVSCQAEAAAIYVSLRRRGILSEAMKDRESFLKYVYGYAAPANQTGGLQEAVKKHLHDQGRDWHTGNPPVTGNDPAVVTGNPPVTGNDPAVVTGNQDISGESAADTYFHVGDVIHHKTFGEGTVTEIDPVSSSGTVMRGFMVVRFNKAGVRKLQMKAAQKVCL